MKSVSFGVTHPNMSKGKGSKTEAFPGVLGILTPFLRGEKSGRRSVASHFHVVMMECWVSGDRLNRAPASNRSFVCRRSTKYSGGGGRVKFIWAQSHLFMRMERNGMHLTNNLSDTTIAEGHLFLKVD
jgi:hypothetical protein